MNPKHGIAIMVLIIFFVISACGGPAVTPESPSLPSPTSPPGISPNPGSEIIGEFEFGESAQWPAYIPDDIPVFKGNIRKVMEAPGSHIRIFYTDVTKDQIDEYLQLLEKNGFHLEYLVYFQEGFPDNSEERIKNKDWDAVDIIKGEYHMNIGYGEGNIAYDIYTTGFAEAIPTPTGLEMPVELINVVPKPEHCPIEKVFSDTSGGYQIICRPTDDKVSEDYLLALQAAGYVPVESDVVSPIPVYRLGDLEISVEQHSSILVLINIRRIDLSKTSWPAELVDIVPPPEGCPIKNVSKWEGIDFTISCVCESDQSVANYINILISKGFSESNRMTLPGGELVSASLEYGNWNVQLLISSMNAQRDLIINVMGEN